VYASGEHMKVKVHTPETFWNRIKKSGENDCWPWVGANRAGYGTIKYQGRWWRSNRLAYFLTHNKEPVYVCHTCDNPPCCNPKHLFAGNKQINVDDMVQKKRHAFGVRNPRAVLTDAMVLEIRRIYSEEYITQADLSRRLNISVGLVKTVIAAEAWKHLNIKPISKGKRNHKLRPETVRDIFAMWKTGSFLQKDICKKYGLCSATVSQLLNKKYSFQNKDCE